MNATYNYAIAVFILLGQLLCAFEQDLIVDNNNFILNTTIDKENYVYDYNRIRFTHRAYEGDFSSEVIIDNDTILAPKLFSATSPVARQYANALRTYNPDVPFRTSVKLGDDAYDRVKLYRASVSYQGITHALKVGLQRVSFGVGRVWTPTDMFNPLNSLSLETSIRMPVFAAQYAWAIDETTSLQLVASIQENNATKYAARLKSNVGFADMALVIVQETKRRLVGYELEGALFQTGVELRSEGGLYQNTEYDTNFVKMIVGADYAFENGIMLTGEYLYNQTDNTINYIGNQAVPSYGHDTFTDVVPQIGRHYSAVMATYAYTMLTNIMILNLTNMHDASGMVVPSFSYSLSDEASMRLGAFISYGADKTEFGSAPMMFFGNVSITF